MECLRNFGCCPETVWPYNPEQLDDNEGHGPPPRHAGGMARKHRAETSERIDIPDIKEQLVLDTPVVFGVPVFPSWGNFETLKTGRIPMPLPGEPSVGGHALSLCGFRDDPEAPGGGWFIFRNSWGKYWASKNADGPGYGLLPYAYMNRYGRDLYLLKLKTRSAPVSRDQMKKTVRKIEKMAAGIAVAVMIGTSVLASIAAIKTVLTNPPAPEPVIVSKQKPDPQPKRTEKNNLPSSKAIQARVLFQTYHDVWDEMNQVR